MARKPSLNDQIARSQTRATWIASAVSAIALVVSVFSLYESHEARMSALRDDLRIQARRPRGDSAITVLKVEGPMHHGAIWVPWDVLISNTGTSTASITGYEVLQIADVGGEILYSGLNRGLVSPEDGKPTKLPLTLEAGKSVILQLIIGIKPGEKAYKLLSEMSADRQAQLPLFSVEKLLAKHRIDIYDNAVAPLLADGEVSGWSVTPEGKEQTFLLSFRTARGVEFKHVTSWYDMKRF